MRKIFLKCPILTGFSLLKFRKLKSRSHGIMKSGNDKRNRCPAMKSNTSLNDLSTRLREHRRHAMLSFLSSLPVAVLRIVDIETNRFTIEMIKCMTMHF